MWTFGRIQTAGYGYENKKDVLRLCAKRSLRTLACQKWLLKRTGMSEMKEADTLAAIFAWVQLTSILIIRSVPCVLIITSNITFSWSHYQENSNKNSLQRTAVSSSLAFSAFEFYRAQPGPPFFSFPFRRRNTRARCLDVPYPRFHRPMLDRTILQSRAMLPLEHESSMSPTFLTTTQEEAI